MLTPVEERPAAEFENDHDMLSDLDGEDEEEDSIIISSTSNKIDGPITSLSRSGSALSNQGATFFVDSEVSSTKDSISILSGGDATPPTLILAAMSDEVAVRKGEESEEAGSRVGGGGQEEPKGFLSQSSDDSSTFSDPPSHLRPLLTKIASSAEETPTQRIPDSSQQRHDVLSDGTSSFQRPGSKTAFTPQKSQSLRGRSSSGGQQHLQPISSVSCSAILVSSSFSEGSAQSKKKYSVSEKYARYEQCHSSSVMSHNDGSKDKRSEGRKEEEGEGLILESEVDSGPAIIEEEAEREVIESEGNTVKTRPGKGSGMERGEIGTEYEQSGVVRSSEGGMELNKRLFEVREVSSASKQCDSGIDDTPESSKSFKDGIRRLSMPPSDDDVPIADSKPLSHVAAFASRESGIADSPVPELSSDEVMLHKVQRSPPQQIQSSLLLQQQQQQEQQKEFEEGSGRKSPQVVVIAPEVELIPLESDEELESDAPVSFSVDRDKLESDAPVTRLCSSFSVDRDRSKSVPRSLENPSFSRYARTPIRDSRLLRASESPQHDGVGLRYRSVSMDKIPTFLSKSSEADDTLGVGFKEMKRHDGKHRTWTLDSKPQSLPSSRSTSFIPYLSSAKSLGTSDTSTATSTHHSSVMEGHPNTRFCVTSPESPSSPSTSTSHSIPPPHSSSHPAPHSYVSSSPSSSPTASPMARRRAKISKGLKQKLKPALRVFKISSGSSGLMTPSPILGRPPPREDNERDEGEQRDFFDVRRRVRMVSPEAVAVAKHSSKVFLRRSRSSEDLIDVTDSAEVDGEEGEDFRHTKIGGLVVVPEHKHKSRGKFLLGRMKRKKTASADGSPRLGSARSEVAQGIESEQIEGSGDPVLLAYGYLSPTDGSGVKSPKNKKRQRLPHFV